MPRALGLLIRWSLLPLLLILAEAMASELFRALRGQGLSPASLLHPIALWFAAGLGFRILFAVIMRRLGRDDPFEFIDTLEHELTHALVGYATFCPPVSLSASLKAGGEVELKGANPLAVLAPYFLPLWCLSAMALGLVVKSGLQQEWNNLLFFLLGSFCYRIALEYRWRQTDLHVYGFTFSTCVVFIFLLLMLGLILHVRGLLSGKWLGASALHAWHTLPLIWAWARDRIHGRAAENLAP
jgi:hypothetical protein